MALRERNPNALGPLYSRDETWKKCVASKQEKSTSGRPEPSSSKENVTPDVFSSEYKQASNQPRVQRVFKTAWNNDKEKAVLKGCDQNQASNRAKSLYESFERANDIEGDDLFKHFECSKTRTLGVNTQDSSFRLSPIKNSNAKRWVVTDQLAPKSRSSIPPSLQYRSDTPRCFPTNLAGIVNRASADKKLDYSTVAKLSLTEADMVKLVPMQAPSVRHMELTERKPSPPPGFTLEDYGRTLHRMGESKEDGAAERAESILRDILNKFASGLHTIQPDGACYNSVIHAYAQCGRAEKAESVLRLMFKDYQDGNEKAEPNVRVYTNVLHAWRKAKAPNAPERCEAILKEMYELSDTGILPACKPDTFAVTVLLHCWTESNRHGAAMRAESIFRKMKNRFLAGEQAQCPDCIAYSIVLNKFAQESMADAAEEILFEMVDDYLSGNDSAKPRTRNFNTVLAMYSKSNASNAPQRAEAVVARFRTLSNSGAFDVHPDEYTYSLLLKTWVTTNRKDGIDRAVTCLKWMRELSQAGEAAATPDIVKYTTIISAYARSGKVSQAGDMLMAMVEDFVNGNELAKPDYKAFDIVISSCTAWNNEMAEGPGHSWLAETILRRMWMMHDCGTLTEVRPKAAMYKNIIICYKKSMNAGKAELLLREMDLYFKRGKLDAGPTKKLFQTVINAWHESSRSDKQTHLQKLRVEMNERFGRKPCENKLIYQQYPQLQQFH